MLDAMGIGLLLDHFSVQVPQSEAVDFQNNDKAISHLWLSMGCIVLFSMYIFCNLLIFILSVYLAIELYIFFN